MKEEEAWQNAILYYIAWPSGGTLNHCTIACRVIGQNIPGETLHGCRPFALSHSDNVIRVTTVVDIGPCTCRKHPKRTHLLDWLLSAQQ